MAHISINRRIERSVYDPELRELDLIWASVCIPFTEGMMWDPYAFPKEENQGLTCGNRNSSRFFVVSMETNSHFVYEAEEMLFNA